MFTSNLKGANTGGTGLFSGNASGNQAPPTQPSSGGMFSSGTGYTASTGSNTSNTGGYGFFSGNYGGGSSYTTGATTTGTVGGSYGFFGNKPADNTTQQLQRETRELYSGAPIVSKGVTVVGAPMTTTNTGQTGYSSGFFSSTGTSYGTANNNVKVSAVEASSILAEAKLIKELTMLRPLGSGLPSLKIESETSNPRTTRDKDKNNAMELEKYRIFYVNALNQIENFRLSTNPYLNKLVSSFQENTRQQILQAHKVIREGATNIEKLRKSVAESSAVVRKDINARREADIFKIKMVASKLATFRVRLNRVGAAIDIQRRFEEGVRYFITDFKQNRELDLSKLPDILRQILNLMASSVEEIFGALEDLHSMGFTSRNLTQSESKHYMESFGQIFQDLMEYSLVVARKANLLREWLRDFRTHQLNTREFRAILPTKILAEQTVEPLAKKLENLGHLFFS